MDNMLWDIYLSLQNELPYKDSFANSNHQNYNTEITDTQLEFRDKLEDYIDLTTIKDILVVGPGGYPEVNLLTLCFPDASVYALTNHEPEANHIQQHFNVLCMDMHDMQIKNKSLDFIFSNNVLEHSLSPYICLMEYRRILRDGKFAYIILPSFEGSEGGRGLYHLYCMGFDMWEELFRKTGFSIQMAERLGGGENEGYYMIYLLQATTVLHPHDKIFARISSHKGSL